MEYTSNKLSKMSGVSARTLRYYDEIGLLKPARVELSGYRIYRQDELDTLQMNDSKKTTKKSPLVVQSSSVMQSTSIANKRIMHNHRIALVGLTHSSFSIRHQLLFEFCQKKYFYHLLRVQHILLLSLLSSLPITS